MAVENKDQKTVFRLAVLIISIIGAFVYWYPITYGYHFYPGDYEEFFLNLDPVWLYFSYFNLVIAIPLNAVAVLRKDFTGILGMLLVISVIIGLKYLYIFV